MLIIDYRDTGHRAGRRKVWLACPTASQKTSDTDDEAQILYRDNICFPNAILSRAVSGHASLGTTGCMFLAFHFQS